MKNTEPYQPGEQPYEAGVIKLNTNENPYPPSPKSIESMKLAVNDHLRRYPSPTLDQLKIKIGEKEGVSDQNVFVGNGSDEVLAFAFQAFFEPNEAIKFPEITYSFYPVYCKLFDIPFQEVPLKEDLSIDVEGMKSAIGGVIFPNPNAPTGIALNIEQVEEIVKANANKVVIIDEAYVDFGAESAVQLTHTYPNLLVTKTLSKSHALAGMRLGYAVGQKHLIQGLIRIKNSFNSYTINRVTLAGAEAAVQDEEYYREILNQIIATREWCKDVFEALSFEVVDSKANFLFLKPLHVDAAYLYEQLKIRGIYVRFFNKPVINGYIRVTVGTDEEMRALIQAVKEIVRCQVHNYV